MEHYLALYEPDPSTGGYAVTLPDFGYGAVVGRTDQEAEERAQDLLTFLIADCIYQGKPLPSPSRRRGPAYRPVRLSVVQTMKLELYSAFVGSGLKKAAFARRLGTKAAYVDRLFSLRHYSKFEQIESALAAFGKRVNIEVRDATA
jgi:antitoxin HicB